MKKSLTAIRWVVGLLFIFSGIVKANDPLGLSYKMQEFFELWGLANLNDYTLSLALIMNVFEVLAGVAVIVGWGMRLFSWLLLLLIVFFCFLTAYAYITGNVRTCGCFGDCLPLTPLSSFIKDLVLFVLIIVLFIKRKFIYPHIVAPLPQIILLIAVSAVAFLQYYALNYLPPKDCLPFKKGSNIIKNMQLPHGAVADSFAVTFRYKKNGKIVEFDANQFPADFDSSFEYVDRYQKLVKKGSGEPPITDFSLKTTLGTDTTLEILNGINNYIMLLSNDFSTYDRWHNDNFRQLEGILSAKHIPLFVVTSDKTDAMRLIGNDPALTILIADGTVIKTAARVNPTYFLMEKANISDKYSYKNIDKVIRQIENWPRLIN